MSVAWVAVGAAAAGTVYSANKASSASKNATNAASNVASQELALSKETLDFYKQQYADQKPLQERAANTAFQVADAQLASQKQNDAISKDYWDYQKNTFRPLEAGIVSDAQNYDTAARRDEKAAGAVADVGMQAEMARQAQTRTMQRMGVNPGSGKMIAMQSQMGLSEAASKAGAANQARDSVELQGYARKMDAANLGRGLASSQATSAGVALNAGNSAVGNAGQPLTQAQNTTGVMGQGYSTALQGMGSASNAFQNIAGSTSNGSDIWGGIGSIAGQFAGSAAGSKAMADLFKK